MMVRALVLASALIASAQAAEFRSDFERLIREAQDSPLATAEKAQALTHPEWRDRILRQAFASAVARDSEAARQLVPKVLDRPWAGSVSFQQALRVAVGLPEAQQKAFLMAVAKNNPQVAVRDYERYRDLPFATELFESAVLLAPDEAVAVATGTSEAARVVRETLEASSRREITVLSNLLRDSSLDEVSRMRLALFVPLVSDAQLAKLHSRVTEDHTYFASLVDQQLRTPSRLLERALEMHAQTALISVRDGGAYERKQLNAYSARDLYFLLVYGRTEATGRTDKNVFVFDIVFDDALRPKLKGKPASKLLAEVRYAGLRHFLALAAGRDRLASFWKLAGPDTVAADLLARTVRNLDAAKNPLEQAVAAAEVLDTLRSPARLKPLARIIRLEHGRLKAAGDRRNQTLYGMLAVRFARNNPKLDPELDKLARTYAGYVQETRVLEQSELFRNQVDVQRHFFWNDSDGVESFESFIDTYGTDPRWHIEKKSEYVHLSASGARGRKIEIYANVPVDLLAPGNRHRALEVNARQEKISRILADRKLEPLVLVHRGHSYHLEKTLPYLSHSARLVYLGSCNGMDKMAAVAERASSAQIIATRGVGTMKVNDPTLKAINDELLASGRLQWASFWPVLARRVGVTNDDFREYIPPHQNAAASLLGAYFEFLLSDSGQ